MKKLLEYQKKINNLTYTINLLEWELKINSSKSSSDDLINLISNYETELFNLITSSKYEKILLSTIESKSFSKLSIEEQICIKRLLDEYNKYKRIPSDFYTEYVSFTKKSNIIWEEAKNSNNYSLYKPYLERVIELSREYYGYMYPNLNLYDGMLNSYELGVESKTVDLLFNEIKESVINLIPNKIKKYEPIIINYSSDELIEAAKYLLDYIGFDNDRGTLGIYPHGFTDKICDNDVRIAFKHGTDPIDFVSTIIHEGGHGIFEQNISSKISIYSDGGVNSLLGLHESQSRFFENVLGRNINFWIPIYDDIKKLLKLDIDINEFVDRLNHVEPIAIRTESDELTYCLHIILRYEIERDIFNNIINIDDLPYVWNRKMYEYLGVNIQNDSEGLMQDVHWSDGEFGYFPSYLLGNIYDGMLYEYINSNLGNIDDILRNKNIKIITKFLIDNIYINGGAYTSFELIRRITGKDISVKPLINYFESKYKNNVNI